MTWDPDAYIMFEEERTRPAMDLVFRLRNLRPGSIADLGCGPGNSTAVLRDTFPDAEVVGIDSSPEMIRSAEEAHPDIRFQVCDVRDVGSGYDLLFSNACLQWIPGHQELFPLLMSKLSPGGVLAVQMPINHREPLSVMAEQVAAEPRWDYGGPKPERSEPLSPEGYYDILAGCASSVDVWTTTYYHVMDSLESMVEWVRGTRLRPYLSLLGEEEGREMEAEILRRLPEAYSPGADGRYLLRYERLFLVAVRRSLLALVADEDDGALGVLHDVVGDAAEEKPVEG